MRISAPSHNVEQLAFRDSGHGAPVVMLHGLGFDGAVFDHQFESPLSDMFRLISPDLPGHGASADAKDPSVTYTVSGLADVVVQLLDALGLHKPVLMGWSLGGHVALDLMERYPDRVAGVMAVGTPPFGRGMLASLFGFRLRRELLLASKPAYSAQDAERFARLCFGDRAEARHIDALLRANGPMRPLVNRSLMTGQVASQRETAERSPVPLAMVNGADEPLVRTSYVAGLDYARLWENRCHEIPGAGHAPFFSHPHAFNAILHRFATEMSLRVERPSAAPLAQRA
ncbi:alpha/beta fold hydrolase [Pelagibacterium montanilacus]|uniref:alpha/beta fold hydrolase n=1 Tax=Pelagibacterium montanilacus TaxID=2185280 RepID=UPI000F8EA057|nr:alpha/beta hydrolase [Pelagibacterium montanilacus]